MRSGGRLGEEEGQNEGAGSASEDRFKYWGGELPPFGCRGGLAWLLGCLGPRGVLGALGGRGSRGGGARRRESNGDGSKCCVADGRQG
jgi:hypothetical protein